MKAFRCGALERENPATGDPNSHVQRSGIKRFIIEGEFHTKWCGEFGDFADSLAEIRSRAAFPWGKGLYSCPCQSWPTCLADYGILVQDDSVPSG
jgi:hypothetical protein